jgi:hypothetical protein
MPDLVVVSRKLPLLLLVLFAAIMIACQSGTTIEDAYDGLRLSTNDIANPSINVPSTTSAIVRDNFTGNGQSVSGRVPNAAPTDKSIWTTPGSTEWRVQNDAAILKAELQQDSRAVIDAGQSRNWVRVQASRENGSVGLVTRYQDEANWIMAWFDGESAVIGEQVGGVFRELGRQTFDWPESSSLRYLDLLDNGSVIALFVAGQEIVRVQVAINDDGRGVGLFSKGSSKNQFDDFVVWAGGFISLGGDVVPEDEVVAGAGGEIPEQEPPGDAVPEDDDEGDNPPDVVEPTPVDPNQISRGSELLGLLGCGSCHSVEGRDDAAGQIGPPLDGVGDRALTRIPGTPADSYLRDSVIEPGKFVVSGFSDVMPSFESSLAYPTRS